MTKISQRPVLTTAKGNAYIPVVDPDETDPVLQNKRINLATLTAAAANFEPYDPAVATYNKEAPSYVSYNNNVYEYINPTPAAGKTPATNPLFWKIVTAGQFAHQQNTDTGTNNDVFSIGNPQGQDQEGWRVLSFRENAAGRKVAIGYHFDFSVSPEIHELKVCYNYTGNGSDVWADFGGGISSVSINGGDPQVPGPLGHLDIPLENATYDAPGLMVAADKIRMDQQLGPANSQSVRLKVRPTINQREDAGHYYYDIATDGVVTVNNVDYPVNGLTGATFSKTVNYDTVALFYIYLDDDTYKVTFTGSSLANIRYLFGVAGRSYFAFYFIPKNGGTPRPYYWEAPVQKRPTKTITGSYVLTADDHGYNILYDSTSPGTITCPNGNAGSDIVIFQVSTGAFVIEAASGATVENFDSKFKSAGQKAIVSLTCYQRGNAVVWHPNGNLIA